MPSGAYPRNIKKSKKYCPTCGVLCTGNYCIKHRNYPHPWNYGLTAKTDKRVAYHSEMNRRENLLSGTANKRHLSLLGHDVSNETRNKIRLKHLGKKQTREHIDNVRKTKIGKPIKPFHSNFTLEQKQNRLNNVTKANKKIWSDPKRRERQRLNRLRSMHNPKAESTIPELKVYGALKDFKFEKHRIILNRFEIDAFIEPNICIFVDGCYWHGCQKCNIKYTNFKPGRDEYVNSELVKNGYKIFRIWEHDVKKSERLTEWVENLKQEILK